MAMAEEDGDRFIEMVSAGTLYLSGEWERKYWSCSRVGYLYTPISSSPFFSRVLVDCVARCV
jgi:hypothetical protein